MMAQFFNYAVYTWALLLTLLLPWLLTSSQYSNGSSSSSRCPVQVHDFHGGSPNGFGAGLGSCYCGSDSYCLCTPSLAIDAIVEVTPPGNNEVNILLVVRRDSSTKKYAIPGKSNKGCIWYYDT